MASSKKYTIITLLSSLVLSVVFLAYKNYYAAITVSIASSVLCAVFVYSTVDDTIHEKEITGTGGEYENYSPDSAQNKNDGITFDNIAGMEEIKEELLEIADFIKSPGKYREFGANLPKGVLFYGPPGTGKTMIAKALANETGVDFIYASGSEFIEKYVGVGAGRIRTLFENARKKKSCIIFIDEIDAIGASRNIDSNSERDQTLNQLLIELDGFNSSESIVVIGATNRLDLLDKALVRPGRFDRHIYVGNPSESAREKILAMHMKNKPVSDEVNVKNIASRTSCMSGAELANVVNEAAILAIRNDHTEILNDDFDEAILKTTAGIKNSSVMLSQKDTRIVAVHEAGHALAHIMINNSFPQQISIVSRSQALGMVVTGEGKDENLINTEDFEDKICVLLAGRAAEEVIIGKITTGAQNDIKRATEIANAMISEYGMSEDYFNMTFTGAQGAECKNNADRYISGLLKKCYIRTVKLIRENEYVVKKISDILIDKKTINESEIRKIVGHERLKAIV